ncbi:MAG: alpha/beta hydrolase [SAR324 cluster bacterium]|nr:alpha/beta hydrolase [SAR324 cluster bacterium]
MHQSEFFQDSKGESRFFRVWAKDSPKAVVLLVHGMGEHSGRYHWLAGHFNGAGYACVAIDLTGHGQSSGTKGHSPSFERFFQDIESLKTVAEAQFPGCPQVLFGHSMGGSISSAYLLARPKTHNFKALILSSPGFAPAEKPAAIRVFLGKILYHLLPSIGLPNELVVEGLSRDPENIKTYLADPLNHDRLSPRLGLDCMSNGQNSVAAAEQITIPCFQFHGSKDLLASYSASKQFSENMGTNNHFETVDGGFHEILNDFDKLEMTSKIINWLSSTLSRQ